MIVLAVFTQHRTILSNFFTRQFFFLNSNPEKCCEIIDLKLFLGLLTDRSQARKTGDDKEMVLLKTDYKSLYDLFYES